MIGTRTPFRVSFIGGGSDMPAFYRQQPGSVVSATINKYMYIFVHPLFDQKIQIKYSKTELVDHIDQIQHPIVREALRQFEISNIDINSIADIPAGTGLGSSSSFTVGLLQALYAYSGRYAAKEKLAVEACSIEIDRLGEPIGKQDQYAAAYGGLNFITFYPDESVNVEPIIVKETILRQFEKNLVLYYLGESRMARDILYDQELKIRTSVKSMRSILNMTKLAEQLKQVLISGSLDDVGRILDEGWQLKKQVSAKISRANIDKYYERAKRHGALGGKLLGAGGGGFLLFYCPDERQEELREALPELREMKCQFDMFGTKVIHYDQTEEQKHPWAYAPGLWVETKRMADKINPIRNNS